MSANSRRRFLGGTAAAGILSAMPPLLREALAVPARKGTGTIGDVRHIVILMQENRSFDHYFGTLAGVRGFGDRLTIPLPDGRTVWQQHNGHRIVMPYRLDQSVGNAQPRMDLPHTWPDAQAAWDEGRMASWPRSKTDASMAYYTRAELPIQFALAEAFTLCDAYHCSLQGGTNPNRLFMLTGTNNPTGVGGGPLIDNRMEGLGPPEQGFNWMTYAERLEAAGVSWKVYQDMDDNFGCNLLQVFRRYREAFATRPNPLADKALSTTLWNATLDGLRDDVVAGKLPQVSWVIPPQLYSEHPSPSTPVQGGAYTLQVLEALLADPDVWAGTVLLQMYDENDAFFDHMPPPAAPSWQPDGSRAGKSTVDFTAECHTDSRLYGLGPRVPMLVMSPWSKGGWVNSQVFDHTSILRFLERRFGIAEPNIAPWRRTVCGDLTSCFDFAAPDARKPAVPVRDIAWADAVRASQRATPPIEVPPEGTQSVPRQESGTRPSRGLPYRLEVTAQVDATGVTLSFDNNGGVGAVLHVYDRRRLELGPRRYTLEADRGLSDRWTVAPADGLYDLWVLGPNGFHRHVSGRAGYAALNVSAAQDRDRLVLTLHNPAMVEKQVAVTPLAYATSAPVTHRILPDGVLRLPVTGPWYDIGVREGESAWRFAGRIETGAHSVSDPAFGLAPASW